MKLSDKLCDLTKWVLQTFEDTVPEDILNNARKSGEALCKAVLLKHHGDEDGHKIICGYMKRDKSHSSARNPRDLNFETLINYVTDDNNYRIIKNQVVRNKIYSNLKLIQSYGNPASHDPNTPEARSRSGSVDLVKFALADLIILLYEEYLNESLPEPLVQHFSDVRKSYVEGENDSERYENVRGLEIVKLCYPRQKIIESKDYSDSKNRISYEFIAIEVARENIIGHLFVKKRITIEKTVQSFIDNLTIKLSNLKICSPKVINSDTGKEVDRLRSLREKFTSIANEQLSNRTEYFYIDDFVWEYCLLQDTENSNLDIDQEQYFIDQELFPIKIKNENSTKSSPQLSLDFVKELLESSERKNPVNIIVGRGGVGKSTFCDQAVSLINSYSKKKALLISSTDLRDVSSDSEINSITDLYELFVSKVKNTESRDILELNNLEINISCGNIVLIIDGLDEIESTLGSDFDLDRFLRSAIDLNEAYHRCSIVITSRDYYRDRYLQRSSENTFELRGFSNELVDKYLEKRLQSKPQIRKAKKYLTDFQIAEQDRHTPLYLALISELLEREELLGDSRDLELSGSEYYYEKFPVDKLIYQLLYREIKNQSLDITCDDYFKLLAEISIQHKGLISRKDLNEYIDLEFLGQFPATAHDEKEKYKQIYVSPILLGDESSDAFKIKYDFMEMWIKSRLFFFHYQNDNCTPSMKSILSEFYDGSSPLLEELVSMKTHIKVEYLEKGKKILEELIKAYQACQDNRQAFISRKSISGLLYFCLSGNESRNKSDNTEIIVELFGNTKVFNLCIFGKFFPLDFTKITIHDGWLERYESFDKCKFPNNSIVFYDSTLKGIKPKRNMTSNTRIFDNCKLNEELKIATYEGKNSVKYFYDRIKDDIKRILKVGFSQSHFSWKSEGVYKTEATPKGLPLKKYLNFLVSKNVLIRIQNRNASGSGYEVSKHFKDSAKYLITNGIVKPQMEMIIKEAIREFHNIDI